MDAQNISLKQYIGVAQQYRSHVIAIALVIASLVISKNVFQGWNSEKKGLEKRKVERARYDEMKKKMTNAEKSLKEYQLQLLDNDFFILKNTVEKITRNAAVRVVSLKPGSEQVFGSFKKMDLSLIVQADYPELIDFMQKIEESAMPIQIELMQISIERQSRKEDKSLSVDIKVSGMSKK